MIINARQEAGEDEPRLVIRGGVVAKAFGVNDEVGKRYEDRSQWCHVHDYAARVGIMRTLKTGNAARAVARYVGVKALLGGATRQQGMRSTFGSVEHLTVKDAERLLQKLLVPTAFPDRWPRVQAMLAATSTPTTSDVSAAMRSALS